jgi:hypothetical protein
MKWVKVDEVEATVEDFYGRFQLSPGRIESIKTTVMHELGIETQAAQEEAKRQARIIDRLALAAALSNPCWEAKRLLGLTSDPTLRGRGRAERRRGKN